MSRAFSHRLGRARRRLAKGGRNAGNGITITVTPGRLLRLGYAGLGGAEDLRHRLAGHPVDLLVDIRYSRRSRIAAFRGEATRATVLSAGIREYAAEPRLGNRRYREPGRVELVDPSAIDSLLPVLRRGGTVALMCLCRSSEHCHRRQVAQLLQLAEPSIAVVDLEA